MLVFWRQIAKLMSECRRDSTSCRKRVETFRDALKMFLGNRGMNLVQSYVEPILMVRSAIIRQNIPVPADSDAQTTRRFIDSSELLGSRTETISKDASRTILR